MTPELDRALTDIATDLPWPAGFNQAEFVRQAIHEKVTRTYQEHNRQQQRVKAGG